MSNAFGIGKGGLEFKLHYSLPAWSSLNFLNFLECTTPGSSGPSSPSGHERCDNIGKRYTVPAPGKTNASHPNSKAWSSEPQGMEGEAQPGRREDAAGHCFPIQWKFSLSADWALFVKDLALSSSFSTEKYLVLRDPDSSDTTHVSQVSGMRGCWEGKETTKINKARKC